MRDGVDNTPPATLLAFDTSTERMAVGLAAKGLFLSRDELGGARASAALLPTIAALLAEAGAALADLDAIAFGCGPGAFTGLRTACSVAQGLALGLGKPLLPIASLLIVAEDARQSVASDGLQRGGDRVSPSAAAGDDFAVWACVDARMDEIYAAEYAWHGGRWTVLRMPMLLDCAALSALWEQAPPVRVAGDALSVFADRLQPGAAQRHPGARPRAKALLHLARQAWRDGATVDAADALPLYVRDRVAATTAEREQRRAALG